MEKVKISFFDTKPYDRDFFDKVNKDFGYEITYFSDKLNENTVRLTRGSNVVCIFVNDKVDEKMVNALKENGVELIALRCAGYNNVDLGSVFGSIHVVRVPAYSPHAVAEHAAALLLGLNRKIYKAYLRVREGNFSINGLLGKDLYGKKAGIIGTGKIGKCMVDILKGFGMQVSVHDPYPDEEFARERKIKYVGLDEIFGQSDVISLHCPLTPETNHIIDAESISRMKDGVILINTGRGALVNTKDLIDALKNEKIGAAGLDVYEEEGDYFFEDLSFSVISDDVLARLLTFPNVLVTSHQGFFTREALNNIADTTLNNIKEFKEGGYLKNEICYKCGEKCKKEKKKRCF
jgi:D-lactate dehydrogenase